MKNILFTTIILIGLVSCSTLQYQDPNYLTTSEIAENDKSRTDYLNEITKSNEEIDYNDKSKIIENDNIGNKYFGYNAFLGTTELIRLYDAYTPSPLMLEQPPIPLVIAGYNAGNEAVDRWLSDFEDPPSADTFGAFVGYTETRKYVQRVLGYMMRYNCEDPLGET